MTEFQHSIVLFCGDDGLPLEFNVRNTNEKGLLKAMIEHGGGLCSQSANAVHLISPGTKVLNADLGKKLVSSRYIFDCAKENYLLDVNDYVFTVSESQTSDISDDESEKIIPTKPFFMPICTNVSPKGNSKELHMDTNDADVALLNLDEKMDCSDPHTSVPKTKEVKNSSTGSSNESFIEASIEFHFDPKITPIISSAIRMGQDYKPLTSTAKETDSTVIEDFNQLLEDCSPVEASASLVPAEMFKPVNDVASDDRLQVVEDIKISEKPSSPSSVHTVVTSSQPNGDLDQFDNLLLNKIQQKPQSDDEECLSQSYTVSSSADAQVTSKPNSVENNSAEIFAAATSASPDSPAQETSFNNNRFLYIQKLEPEVEKILQKPSPKSIQDKITLVKYICCVKKLPPSVVLASLGHF